MDLFSTADSVPENCLPYDGDVRYFGPVIGQDHADACFDRLMEEVSWAHDELVMFGKPVVTRRKVAWYGDRPYSYTYSRATKSALPWTPVLEELKGIAQQESGDSFNSCLLNLYHTGEEGMGWHSDAEQDLKKQGAIASISLGSPRAFVFRHKHTQERVSVMLEHGSLLVMKGATQSHWLHSLPPTRKIQSSRINLTFRTIAD